MAIINLFSGTFKGAVIMTGNSIGISTAAGTQIGAFAIGLPTNTPPAGSTTTIAANDSASAQLTLPATATVVSAFLLWSATSSSSGLSIGNGNQNNNINLRDPRGITTSVTPAVAFRQLSGTISTTTQSVYSNAADITSIVQAAGSGFYTPGGILGVTGANGEHNGWLMMVAYQDQTEPYRNINMWTALDSVQGGGTPRFVDIPISGFSTPSLGATPGRLILSAGNGNAELAGDFVRFGPTISNLATLSGPNNGATNFFASQINNNNGTLDTTGTFGTRNSTPGVQTPAGSRNNWDVTRVDASPGLTNNQNSAIIRVGTLSDTLVITGVGLQVDVNAANLTPMVKTVDKAYANIGETLTYTISFKNAGLVNADNTVFLDTIPTGTTFIGGTVEINGTRDATANPAPPSGINLGTISVNQTTTIRFQVRVGATLPTPNPLQNKAETLYTFIPATSLPSQNGESMSNIATTTIATVFTTSTKSVDKVFANIGDTVTYTIVVQNTGNTSANNVLFIDTIPNGTAYIAGTLRQDGNLIAGTPNPPGTTLNNIGGGTTSTIIFSVKVNQFPVPNPFINNAAMGYTYTSDPSNPNAFSGNTQTNTVATQVNAATIPSPIKTVDKAFAKIGDTLNYTLYLQNTGNTTALNVVVIDTTPNNTTFQPNSIRINGVIQPGATIAPPTGLTVSSIPAGSTVSVTFQVVINTIPTPNPIPNTATMAYSYLVDPTLGTTGTGNANTNRVTTQVNTAIIGTTKSTSIINGFVGDTVLYTMVLRNSGNTTATNITLFDTIPRSTTFVADSIEVNGVPRSGINPQINGVTLPDLAVGGVVTVTFRVVIDTVPSPNPTTNASTTNYSYLLDSSTPTTITSSSNSNIVDTYVNPNTNPLKMVSQDHGTLGTTLTYTIVWRNVTNETQTNVIFVDTLPNGVTFIPNTLNVNGVTITGGTITPPNGVNTGTLPVNSLTTVTYQVVVNTIPNPNPIPNTASVTNTGVGGTQAFESNEVDTEINYAQLGVVRKTVDKAYATVDETVLYTIVLSNTGNTTANNVVITDTIPNGTSFEINTVTIDGTNQPGLVVAPPTGLTLSCIPVGKVTTITFQVKVVSIPNPNRALNSANVTNTFVVDPVIGTTQSQSSNTNITTTTLIDATIVPVKAVSKAYANVGDTLIYTVTLAANGNTTANSVVFTDSLPSTVTYVPGTFAINGVPVPGGNPLSQSIGSLTVPAIYTITFNAVVNTIPNPNPIANTATTSFTFTVIPTIPNDRSRQGTSNTVNTNVNNASLGGITKHVDRVYADCGDTITYTIDIPNSGNVVATNVLFKDTIPNGTLFVPDSVYVRGIRQPGASPSTGVNIGNIAPSDTVSVTFSVVVQC